MRKINFKIRSILFQFSFLKNKVLIIGLLLFSQALSAQDPASLFKTANNFYTKNNFESAIEKYEQLIKSGYTSSEVYFNLGNAYYKTKNIPAAILNFERAKKLKPADPDINFNLQLANANTIDKIEPIPQVFYQKWWMGFTSKLSADGYAWRGLIFLWIALFISIIYLFANNSLIRRITFLAAFIMVIVGLFAFYISSIRSENAVTHKGAIIFTTNVYIKGSPDEKSTNLFMLHSGTKVEVVDELQNWKRIRIANGNEGWIPANAIEII